MNQDPSFPSKIIIKTIHEMTHSLDGGRNWSLTPCVNIGFLSEGILCKQKEQKCFFFIHVSLFFVINSSIHRTLLLRKKKIPLNLLTLHDAVSLGDRYLVA